MIRKLVSENFSKEDRCVKKTYLLHGVQSYTSVMEPVITSITGNHVVIRVIGVLAHAEDDRIGVLLAEKDERAIFLQFQRPRAHRTG